MMDKEGSADLWKSWPEMFQATATSRDMARGLARDFWARQTATLDAMQAFADGWFERRYAGTRAAMEASMRMCSAETPMAARATVARSSRKKRREP